MNQSSKQHIILKNAGFKIIRWSTISLAGLILIAVISFFALQTDYITNRLINVFNRSLYSKNKIKLEIKGIKGIIPFRFKIGELKLYDRSGRWLSIQDCSVRVAPMDLFKGRLFIEKLYIKKVEIDRVPVRDEKRPVRVSEGFKVPPLISRIVVGDITVPQIDMGINILGTPAHFRLRGGITNIEAEGKKDITLQIERTDNASGSLMVSFSLDNNSRYMALKISAEDPGKGILYHFTGIGEDFKCLVEGKGELTDWHGKLHMSSMDTGEITSDINIRALKNFNLNIAGHFLFEDSFINEKYHDLIGKGADFKIDAAIINNREILFNLLRIKAGKNEAGFKGIIRSGDLNSEGKFSLKIDDLASLEKIVKRPVKGSLSVEGVLKGKLFRPDIYLSYSVTGLVDERFETSEIKGAGNIRFFDKSKSDILMSVSADGNINEFLLRSGEHVYHEKKMGYNFELVQENNGNLALKNLNLESSHFSFSTSGYVNNKKKQAALEGKFKTTDISWFTPQVTALKGSGGFDFKLNADLKPVSINCIVKGAFKPFLMNNDLMILTGDDIRFESNLSFLNQTFRLWDVRLDNTVASLKGSGTYELNGNLDSRIDLFISDLDKISPEKGKVKGAANIGCSVKGNSDNLEIAASMEIDKFAFKEIKSDVVTFHVAGIHTENHDTGKISVELITGSNMIKAGSDFILSGPDLSFSNIRVSGDHTAITGNINLDREKYLALGKIGLSSTDISEITGIYGQSIKGKVSGEFALKPEQERQNIEISVSAENVIFNHDGIEKIHVNGFILDIFNNFRFKAETEVKGFTHQGLILNTVNIKGEGRKDNAAFNLKGAGVAGEELAFEVSAGFQANDDNKSINISTMKGMYGAIPVNLMKPLNIIYSPAAVLAENIDIGVDSGTIRGSMNYTDEKVGGDLLFEKMPLALLTLAGIPVLDGVLEGNVSLGGSPVEPHASGKISIEVIKKKNRKNNRIPPVFIKAEYYLDNKSMSGKFSVGDVSPGSLKGDVTIPCDFSIYPFIFAPEGTGELKGSIQGELDLSSVNSLFEVQDQFFSGRLKTNFDIGGIYSSPIISGKAVLSGGRYENSSTEIVINNIMADISADNSGFILHSLSADDGLKGTVKGNGRLDIDTRKKFPYEINMKLKNMQITGNDKLRTVVGGNLTASGTMEEHHIAGRLTIEKADFQIAERLPVEITELEIKEINTKSAQVPGEIKENPRKSDVKFDIAVSSLGRVFISGRGLDSEWKGDLKLKGTSNDPLITGKLSLIRGKYEFLSKSFTLTEGYVTFFGNTPPDPFFEVTGTTENSSLKAFISLKGDMKNPALSLYSEPALPQDEILSRVLFDKEVSQITPFQALQLAAALNELVSGKKGFDPLKYTRNIVGIDRLEVKQSQASPGDSAVSAGKYLKDNIYIEVEKGISSESGKASVTWELTPNITVETEVGENAENGMGINWKYDY